MFNFFRANSPKFVNNCLSDFLLPQSTFLVKMFIADFINNKLKLEGELPFKPVYKHFKKKDKITNLNEIEGHIYFMVQGIAEVGISRNEEEKIIDFVFPGQFFCCYTSFLTQKPSDVYIKCLTDCDTEALPFTVLQEAFKTSLLTNQLIRIVTESAFMERVKREKDFLSKSAEERYLDLLERRPEVIQLISGARIAKYLGIHPESLSRIRKAIS